MNCSRIESNENVINSFLVESLGDGRTRIRGKKAPSLIGPSRHQRQQGVQQQMSSLAGTVLGMLAAAFIDSDATTPVYRTQRGFAGGTAITRSSAGVYVLTLSDAISLTADLLISATVVNTTFGTIAVGLTSGTTLTTSTASLTVVPATTAADLDYFIKVEQFGPT